MTHRLIISDAVWCWCSCKLFFYWIFLSWKKLSLFQYLLQFTWTAGVLSRAAFVKEIDNLFHSFIGATCNPDYGKVLHYWLSRTSKHLEHCQNAVNKIKSCTFLNKEWEQICPPPSLTGCLIKIAAVQHVWRRVNDEGKFKYLETQNLN